MSVIIISPTTFECIHSNNENQILGLKISHHLKINEGRELSMVNKYQKLLLRLTIREDVERHEDVEFYVWIEIDILPNLISTEIS